MNNIEKDLKELEKVCRFDLYEMIKKENIYQIMRLSAIVNVLIELGYSQKNICRNLKITEKEYNFYRNNKIISLSIIGKIKLELMGYGINHDYKSIFKI